MKLKENVSINRDISRRHAPVRRNSRPASNPIFLATFLGVVCVVGVFGMLGLLYAIG